MRSLLVVAVALAVAAARVEAVWESEDGAIAGGALLQRTAHKGFVDPGSLLGGFLVVYSPTATEKQIQEARKSAARQLPRNLKLAKSVHMPSGGGLDNAKAADASRASAAESGLPADSSSAQPETTSAARAARAALKLDVIRGPPQLSRRERARVLRRLRALPGVQYVEEDDAVVILGPPAMQSNPPSW